MVYPRTRASQSCGCPFIVQAGDEDHRDEPGRSAALQEPADVEPVDSGHAYVEQDHVGWIVFHLRERRLAAAYALHLVTLRRQLPRQ
jgi:hypothetical protein